MNEIIFVTPSLKTGGGNRVFIELANVLVKRGMRVRIISPNNSKENHTFFCDKQIDILSIGRYSPFKVIKLYNLIYTLLYIRIRYKNSSIIVSDPIMSIFSFILKRKTRYRFIQSDDYCIFDDGMILGKGITLNIYKFFCRLSYKFKSKYIFNSSFVYQKFCNISYRTDVPLRLVWPGVNLTIFNDSNRQHPILDTDNIRICLIGRKHPAKGLSSFLRMYADLPNDIRIKFQVTIVSHDDLSQFDLSGIRVVVPDNDLSVSEAFKDSDIFISTSWSEGFGLPPLEAMASGSCAIISNSGGINEYASDQENCLIFTPQSEMELKRNLLLLCSNSDLRKKLAANGIRTAKNFTWENAANMLSDIVK